MSITVFPIYNRFFPPDGVAPAGVDWNEFCREIPSDKVWDLRVQGHAQGASWSERAKKVGAFAIRVIACASIATIVGGGIIATVLLFYFSSFAQSVIRNQLVPTQSELYSAVFHGYQKARLEAAGNRTQPPKGHIFRYVRLQSLDGIEHIGAIFSQTQTISNGNWVLRVQQGHASNHSCDNPQTYLQQNLNVLFIDNEPADFIRPHSSGAAQEVGLQYLETAIKAKKIVIDATSGGGAVAAEAVERHTFKPDVKYHVILKTPFKRVSTYLLPSLGRIAQIAFWLIGYDVNVESACRKLDANNIHVDVLEKSEIDSVIPANARLASPKQTNHYYDRSASIRTFDEWMGDASTQLAQTFFSA